MSDTSKQHMKQRQMLKTRKKSTSNPKAKIEINFSEDKSNLKSFDEVAVEIEHMPEEEKLGEKLNETESMKEEVDSSYEVLEEFENELSDDDISEKPKILVQRVFHQPEKNVVEQKLDYVFANSEVEITKHVFGGLFNSKYYPYTPENYCRKHAPDLFEYEDEALPKIGDKFDSLECFRLYVDSKAKDWKYYMKCADSHRKNGKDTFVFQCVFAKPRSKIFKSKGLRKRTRKVPLHECPCRVLLKPVPAGAKDLTVIYVCNHHDHPLTDEYFYKLQHGRRLHPNIKEELMDLLSLDVDREIIKIYIKSLTGHTMSNGFFANVLIYMKKNNVKRQFTVEKLKEMYSKIRTIKEEYGIMNDSNTEENVDDDLLLPGLSSSGKSKLVEVMNVLNTVSAPKRAGLKRNKIMLSETSAEQETKKRRKNISGDKGLTESGSEFEDNKSLLETCLQQLENDKKMMHNVKCLQDSVRTDKNFKTGNQNLKIRNRGQFDDRSKYRKSNVESQSINQDENNKTVVENNNKVHQETPENSEGDNVILYENEVTEANTSENAQYLICEDPKNSQSDNNEASFCIQFETDENDQDNEYILLEHLKNVPVQVEATDFATITILPENNEEQRIPVESKTMDNEQLKKKIDISDDSFPPVDHDEIGMMEESGDIIQDLQNVDVYEVIETNNKKIFPNRDIVRNVILNKPMNTTPVEKRRTSSKNQYLDYFRKHPANRVKHIRKETAYDEYRADVPENIDDSTETVGNDDSFTQTVKTEDDSFENEEHSSEYELGASNLNDDDHYIIVVNDDEGQPPREENLNHKEYMDKILSSNTSSHKKKVVTDKRMKHFPIEEDILILKRYRYLLKKEIKGLRDVRARLNKEISLAKAIRKTILSEKEIK